MSVTTMNRNINELTKDALLACRLFFQQCLLEGVDVFVVEGYRSQARQDWLYAQGRTRPGAIVTWTRNSNHKSRRAWDIGAVQNAASGYNIYNTTVLKKAGAIATKMGITWGGNWPNNIDYPHFEIPVGWKPKKGYDKLLGTVIPATTSTGKTQLIKDGSSVKPPTTTKPPIKEEDKVTVKIPTITDSSSPTLKSRLRADIVKAKSDGVINSDQWLKAFDGGTLNAVDVALIANYINGTPTIASLSFTFRNFIVEVIDKGFKEGMITSDTWLEEAKSGKLKVSDAHTLLAYISARGANLRSIPSSVKFFEGLVLKDRKVEALSEEEKDLYKKASEGKLSDIEIEVLLLENIK